MHPGWRFPGLSRTRMRRCIPRYPRVVDEEVAALLDDDSDDASRFGSDVEDLEEDFVVKASLPEGPVELGLERLSLREEGSSKAEVMRTNNDSVLPGAQERLLEPVQRPRRMIDDQFDMVMNVSFVAL